MTVAGSLISALSVGCSKSEEEALAIDLSRQASTAAQESGYKMQQEGEAVLHVYTWSDYISPDVLASFEKALNCKVKIDTFDSNETMYAKLKAGGAGYDIIMPSSYLVSLMAKEGLITKFDHARIPNVRKNFDKNFSSQILDPTFLYNVPYAVTYTGFMYIKNKVPAGVDINSWKALENSAFNGKITLLDDLREVIGAGLMACGYSINSRNPAEIDAAVEMVLKWKKNVRKFDSESYKTEVASSATWLGLGYSTDATQVIIGEEEGDARDDIGFALPKEGYTIAFDEMVLSSKSENVDLAYAFINYLYNGDVAKVNMEYIMGPMPVKPGIDALDEGYRSQIVLSEEIITKGQPLMPVDDDPAVMELYNKAWDKIKATK
jgi:spermidine/putrescine transport system substrate-binding protein